MLKELSHHALFVHCCCLASLQAANASPGIKHVYTALMDVMEVLSLLPRKY